VQPSCVILWHVELQVDVPGGSHCSPVSTVPFPQTGVGLPILWQVELQVDVFGGSHCSPDSTVPFPQTELEFGVQVIVTFPDPSVDVKGINPCGLLTVIDMAIATEAKASTIKTESMSFNDLIFPPQNGLRFNFKLVILSP